MHFTEFLGGIANRLAAAGVDLTFASTEPEREMEVYQRFATTRRADVLILSSPMIDDPRHKLLHDLKMPFVAHGRSGEVNDFHYYDIDNEGGFYVAT